MCSNSGHIQQFRVEAISFRAGRVSLKSLDGPHFYLSAYLFAYQGIPDPASCRAGLQQGGSVPATSTVSSLGCSCDVTDAGPASHRVRLWQGGPASTYYRFRLLVLQFTGTSVPGVRLLALPEYRKRPWPLRRPTGDVNGGRFVRSPCLPSWCGLRLLYAVHQILFLWSLYRCGPWSSRPQPLGSGGGTTPCEDTRGTMNCLLNFVHRVLL